MNHDILLVIVPKSPHSAFLYRKRICFLLKSKYKILIFCFVNEISYHCFKESKEDSCDIVSNNKMLIFTKIFFIQYLKK